MLLFSERYCMTVYISHILHVTYYVYIITDIPSINILLIELESPTDANLTAFLFMQVTKNI